VYTQEYSPCYLFSFTEQKPITEIFVEAREVDRDRNFNVEAKEAGEALLVAEHPQGLILETRYN